MAEAFFDGHPLEEYLRDSGETPDLMPGGMAEFSIHPYLTHQPYFSRHCESMEKLCFSIIGMLEFLGSLFHSDRRSRRTHAFSERFKYGVISSTLLSPAFATTPVSHHRRSLSPPLPGRLTGHHSRNTSAAESISTDRVSLSIPAEPQPPLWPITLSFTVAVAALSARFYFLFLMLLASTLYYIHVHRVDINPKPDIMTPSLEALQNLISAGQLWDSVINDTFSILENEERSIFYGPTSTRMPSSSLRVALSSSLLTTQTQCDKVRPVLATIASPDELSQLSEMYAPPSPMKSTFSFNNDSRRPSSHPGSRQRTNSLTDRMKKRSTWNGTYTALALAGSPPPFQISLRREKRRSDLSALLSTPPRKSSLSAPTSPSPLTHLPDVSEEDDSMMTAHSSLTGGDEESFGAAALDIQRRRSGGARMLELSQHSVPSSIMSGSPRKRRTTLSSGSRYTTMQPTRHPLSLSALHQSLQCALASKRFACSHLLALRFDENEEGYWEDVRSVMSLLTSALVDATSRLSEVLDEVEEQHFKLEDSVSESPSGANTPSSIASPPAPPTQPLSQMIEQTVSFAPMPSHLSRFSAHVDAISSALNDAREQLEQCVVLLKEDFSPGHSPHASMSSAGDTFDHPAIQAYERLRRELGFALRECERGRERLINIVRPPTPPMNEDMDVLPPLGPDMGNEDAEKMGEPMSIPIPVEFHSSEGDISLTVVSPDGETLDVDDASSHLLLTATSQHLPPPGVEQVFEADTGTVGVFTRERSKLSREERINLARARRERGAIPTFDQASPPPLKMERWGPGGEVVQELKDVIWKVGERRRKMTESHLRSVVSNASSSIPSSPHGSMTPVNILPEGTAS